MNDQERLAALMGESFLYSGVTDAMGNFTCQSCGAKLQGSMTEVHTKFHLGIATLARLTAVLMDAESKRHQSKAERRMFGKPKVH